MKVRVFIAALVVAIAVLGVMLGPNVAAYVKLNAYLGSLGFNDNTYHVNVKNRPSPFSSHQENLTRLVFKADLFVRDDEKAAALLLDNGYFDVMDVFLSENRIRSELAYAMLRSLLQDKYDLPEQYASFYPRLAELAAQEKDIVNALVYGFFYENDPALFERYEFPATSASCLTLYKELRAHQLVDALAADFDYANIEKRGPKRVFGPEDMKNLESDFAKLRPLRGGYVLLVDDAKIPEGVPAPSLFAEIYGNHVEGLFPVTNPGNAQFFIYESYSAVFVKNYSIERQSQPVSVYQPTVHVRVMDVAENQEIFAGDFTVNIHDSYLISGNVGDHYVPYKDLRFGEVHQALALALAGKP